jgi:hypothetical protein
MFGNARTTLYGGGGSGEPTTREVFQGWRTGFAGPGSLGFGGSAAQGTNCQAKPSSSASAVTIAANFTQCFLSNRMQIDSVLLTGGE